MRKIKDKVAMESPHLKHSYTWTILILVLIIAAFLIIRLSDFEDFSSLERRSIADEENKFYISGFGE